MVSAVYFYFFVKNIVLPIRCANELLIQFSPNLSLFNCLKSKISQWFHCMFLFAFEGIKHFPFKWINFSFSMSLYFHSRPLVYFFWQMLSVFLIYFSAIPPICDISNSVTIKKRKYLMFIFASRLNFISKMINCQIKYFIRLISIR